MAEKRHVQHVRSKVVVNGQPKLPSSDSIIYGEIAINYAKGYETLSFKNDDEEIVSIHPITTVQTTGSSLTSIMSQNAVTDELDKKVNNVDLNDKIADAINNDAEISGAINTIVVNTISGDSAITEAIDDVVEGKLVDYYKKTETSGKTELEAAFDDKADSEHTHKASAITDFNKAISEAAVNNEMVISAICKTVSDTINNEVIEPSSNSGLVESIETVVEKYIYGESIPSSSATVVTTDNLEITLAEYAKIDDIPTDLSAFTNSPGYVIADEVDEMVAEAISDSEIVISAITEVISSDSGITEAINAAVEDQLDAAVSGKADSVSVFYRAEYVSSAKTIVFTNNVGDEIGSIDATDFVKDGMIDNVVVSGENIVFIFNADSGKEDIVIPLTDIFDQSSYYNKTDIDNKLGSGFTGANSANTITSVIENNEQVTSAALNDLKENKLDVSAYTPTDLSQYWTSAQTTAAINDSISGKADMATTLEGYGITDAKIENEIITLGDTSIAPITSITSGNVVDALGFIPVNSSDIGTMAAENKNSYSSATEVNAALNDKADSSAVTAEITEAVSGKLDTTVFAAYSGSVDTAIDGKVSSVILTSGSTDGTLKLSVDGVDGDNIVIPGLGSAAFQDVDNLIGSGDVTSMIDGKLGSGFTGENSGKTVTDVINENEEIVSAALNDLNLRLVEISGKAETEEDTITELSGKVESNEESITNLSDMMSYYSGHTTVNSLSEIPTTKRLVIATVSNSNNELSLSGNSLPDGNDIHIIIKNNSSESITVTLPSDGGYVSVGETITIEANATGEVNIISDGTYLYVRGA